MRLKKSTTVFTRSLLIALLLLSPQRVYCQFSDSTIKEINLRLLELHKCRQKQEKFMQLASQDSATIQEQHSQIIKLKNDNFEIKGQRNRYRDFCILSWSVLILSILL
jgi:hypothetical protein